MRCVKCPQQHANLSSQPHPKPPCRVALCVRACPCCVRSACARGAKRSLHAEGKPWMVSPKHGLSHAVRVRAKRCAIVSALRAVRDVHGRAVHVGYVTRCTSCVRVLTVYFSRAGRRDLRAQFGPKACAHCPTSHAMEGVQPVAAAEWRSIKPGPKCRVPWGRDDAASWADKLLESLPQTARNMIVLGQFDALSVVRITGQTVDRTDVLKNQLFLKALVPLSPSSIPSAYFLADVFMELDAKLGCRLLAGASGDHGRHAKVQQALQEGAALRSLWSKIRRNFRDSPESRDEDISAIKRLFKASPQRPATGGSRGSASSPAESEAAPQSAKTLLVAAGVYICARACSCLRMCVRLRARGQHIGHCHVCVCANLGRASLAPTQSTLCVAIPLRVARVSCVLRLRSTIARAGMQA